MDSEHFRRFLQGRNLLYVDVGAQGGASDLSRIASFTHCYGFEPNPDEFKKLIFKNDDRMRRRAPQDPEYARIEYFDLALADAAGEMDLNITANPALSSLLEPDEAVHEQNFKLMRRYGEWRREFHVRATQKVNVSTLEAAAAEHRWDWIDYLKLDTQGTEQRVLKGAEKLLRDFRISLIKCEVGFIPIYKDQCLFTDVDVFLKNLGFNFIDLIVYDHPFYSEGSAMTGETQNGLAGLGEGFRHTLGADAIYLMDMQRLPASERALRARACGVILAELGYLSRAHDILSRHAGLNHDEMRVVFL